MTKIIILKNTTGSPISFLGETVPASGQSDFSTVNAHDLREEPILITAINAGDIVVNNGTDDLSIKDALLYIGGEFFLTIQIDGAPITSPVSYIDTLNFIGGLIVVDEGTGAISVESGKSIGDIQKDDITIVSDVNIINFEGNVLVADDGGGKSTITIGGASGGIGAYNDVLEYGESGTIANKFMKSSYSAHTSLDSTAIALAAGEVVHATISTEKEATNNWFVQVIINGVKGGSGQFAGGTQIGADIEKTTAVLDVVYTNLTGYSFSAGDRIQVYAKEGTLGNKDAVEPVVRLFVRYD